MNTKSRIYALVAIIVVVVLGASGYVLYERRSQAQAVADAPPVPVRDDLTALRSAPHLVFRSTALGQSYGRVAVVPLANADGPRAMTPAACDRVYATAVDAICLSAERGLVTTYKATLLDQEWAPSHDLPLAGIPSRARLSRDGQLVATTAFVFGDSYASPGQFSTRTVVSQTDGAVVGDIEQFELVVDGKVLAARDKNLWGVTFADNDRFYATAASGKKTWLVEEPVGQAGDHDPRGRGVPVAVPRRHAGRVQEARRPARGQVAAGRLRPAQRQGDCARRGAQRRRPGGLARRQDGPLRPAARGCGHGHERRVERTGRRHGRAEAADPRRVVPSGGAMTILFGLLWSVQ
ncbi:hypothetical protein ACFQ1L_44320 [Phytohabitans flavus]|uniref:hypothetical protein n=1 Tax=Phytohabitans flavus TaxID=1076124 RepID=UPI00362C396E